jgi:hypothetical protein
MSPSRLVAKITLGSAVCALVSFGSMASASAGTTPSNYGQCHTYTTSDSAQAPGQIDNGPSTTTGSGSTQTSAGFNGWMRCDKV